MAQDINALNQEIAALRRQLGDAPLTPFRVDELDKALLVAQALRQEFREASGDLDYIAKSFTSILNDLSNQNIYLNNAKKAIKDISNISRDVVDYRRGETSLSETQLKNLQNQARVRFEELKLAIRSGDLQGDNLTNAQEALDKRILFNKVLDRTIELQRQVNKEIGVAGQALEGTGKFLEKLGFEGISRSISEAIKKTKDARLQLKLNKDIISEIEELQRMQAIGYQNLSMQDKLRYQTLKAIYGVNQQAQNAQIQSLQEENEELEKQTSKYKNIFKALKSQLTLVNLTDAIIAKTVESFFKLNEAQTDFRRLTGNSITFQSQLNTELITSVDYIKTAVALTEKLGFNAQSIFPSDTLATAAEMVTAMGATQEQAGQAAIFSKLYGKNLNDINKSIVKGTNNFNATNRSALAGGVILKDVYSTSTELAVSLGKNPDRLAEAVRQAKNLGLTLEQVDKTADSLLNIESSIASEFEAEVITGKQLNLEAARYYALTNQTDKLGKEIAKNQNVISSFATDNRLQQEAIAKTLGLSRKELADMYVQDQLRQGLTAEEIAQNTNLELSDIKRLTTQEAINKSIEKMTQLLAGPLEAMTSLIDNSIVFYGIIGAIGGVIMTQMVLGVVEMGRGLITAIPRLATILGLKAGIAAAEISGAMAATVGLGAIAILGGITLGIGALMSSISKARSTPGLAEGGTVTSGGSVIVGEDGPEILDLKPGATVTPLTKLNAATVVQQTPQPTAAVFDYDKFAQAISKVTVQSNIDGVNMTRLIQEPLARTTRSGVIG